MGNNHNKGYFLGINEGHVDPSVAIVQKGKVLAFAEEERFVRYKHAPNIYPINALKCCLKVADVSMEEITSVGINWNLTAYTDGTMQLFFDELRKKWDVDEKTLAWQSAELRCYNETNFRRHHEFHWRCYFGDISFPSLAPISHHYVHAFQACMQSPFDSAVCITIDGSGDQYCTVVWIYKNNEILPLIEIEMPHSLGWFYAAFTEYLGFKAYDGEYKFMGLAAYGRSNEDLRKKLSNVIFPAEGDIEYRIDPKFIHYGPRNYSGRYTDFLVELMGQKPRLPDERITPWHEDVAYAVQEKLEESVERLVLWAIQETKIRNLCISGGVGLNIKMNSRLFQLQEVHDVFAHPLCSDSGAAAGAALYACYKMDGYKPEPLKTLALGYDNSHKVIEETLKLAGLDFEERKDICEVTAEELAKGRIVGWVQGRMEAGPRALGQRSILADPRKTENRDKVNAIIKFREYWCPFCPSIDAKAMDKYFEKYNHSAFMIIAFQVNNRLKDDAPAIVHVDGTSRVQMVDEETHPRFYQLIKSFEKVTGVPVLLNTSFNVRGEPIVCSVNDALRTFWSTGLDVLVVDNFILRKPHLK
jgi:carbamoyltransferase|tara:strand:+ start:1009 stop:2766 length:1758 start_codon:yes stop_codon:yes gene_type:complete